MKIRTALLLSLFSAMLAVTCGCQMIDTKEEKEFLSETLNTVSSDEEKAVTAEYENDGDENVVFFCQKDAEWEADALGDSKYKMNDSGCLTCCVASVLSMSGYSAQSLPENYNAGDVNRYFSENNVYDGEGNMQWDKLESLTGYTVEKTEKNEIDDNTLDNYLNEGYYPVIRVRVGGIGNYHYVLVVDKRNGEYHCMDPLKSDNKTTVLSEYKNKIYAVRCLVK